MKPDRDKEFEQNMAQLVTLLKKVMKNLPGQGGALPGKQAQFKDGNINMNICFFSFLPLSPEDLEEWEDLYEQYLMRDLDQEKAEELTMDLSPSDLDFLKQNGIQF